MAEDGVSQKEQQEPEYIIKESDIVHVENEFGTTLPVIFVKLFAKSRARPAPTSSELAATAYQAGIECGREEGAAQARNQTLDEIIPWLEKKRKYYGCCSGVDANDDPEDCDPYDTALKKIKSPRTERGEPR